MYYRTPANKITTSWKKWYLSAHVNIKHCKKKACCKMGINLTGKKYAKLIVEILR